jgi:hypothetical protein
MLPRDLYGLPLTTNAAGAEFYNLALGRILRVQPGADAALRAAVRADPDFALAHAGLALLGHEHGVPVDVRAALEAADRATADRAARHTTDREYSQIAAITARVAGAGPRLIRRHLRAYPRDALMLSVAVPTIAFAGAAGVPARAWALVEELAPAYGDDWWYASLLAFVRQEQERWSEAAMLADRALAVEPASGHAAHARTHVYYETGDHRDGLAWLDGWIAGSGLDAQHRVHFSWHAALHELAEGDADAVRQRYATRLAPRTLSGETVSGVRLLVDSASLLWRGSLDSVWTCDAPIQPVLAAVDPALLTEPANRFTALHAALALATARDVDGLARLRLYAVSSADPVFPTVLAPLVSALWAYVDGRFDTAAALLEPIMPALVQLGGSAAQREVVEDTLLYALLLAGRVPDARALLARRLDRRPSRRDMRLLSRAPMPASI